MMKLATPAKLWIVGRLFVGQVWLALGLLERRLSAENLVCWTRFRVSIGYQ